MAFQSIPNCVEVTLTANQNDVPVVNRWYVNVGHDVTHDDLTAVFAAVDAWVTSSLAPQQVDNMFYDEIACKDVDHENGELVTFTPTTTHGGVTDPPIPNSTAIVASLRTNLSGRNFRGRTYFGGMHQNQLVDSTHTSTGVAAGIATLITDLMDALEVISAVLVVVSKVVAGVLRVVAVVTEVTSVIVDTKLDVQRRRSAN